MPTLISALPEGALARARTLAAAKARPGDSPAVPSPKATPGDRNVVRRALRGAHRALGLTTPELLLLDALMFLTKGDDWARGRPIVYARNRTIAEHVPYGERRISALIAALADRGIVLRRYSANGKRWALRGADDAVIDARGIDLTPMIERAAEWTALGERDRAARRARDDLARSITEQRVHLRDALYGYEGSSLEAEAARTRDDLEATVPARLRTTRALMRCADAELHALRDALARLSERWDCTLKAYIAACDAREESTTDAKTDSLHYRQPTPFNPCSPPQERKNRATAAQPKLVAGRDMDGATRGARDGRAFSPALLRRALPHFHEEFGWLDPSTPRGLALAAEATRPSIRVDDALWQTAHRTMGNPTLVHLLAAYVFERLATDGPNGLREPDAVGGYFRRCAERAAAGQLHLAASLYGFAEANTRRSNLAARSENELGVSADGIGSTPEDEPDDDLI